MKFSIVWHKEVLFNELRSLERMREERERYLKNIDNQIKMLVEEIKLHSYQIEEAEKEGKMAFDHERYKIKKNK
jgi:hypothetical protein